LTASDRLPWSGTARPKAKNGTVSTALKCLRTASQVHLPAYVAASRFNPSGLVANALTTGVFAHGFALKEIALRKAAGWLKKFAPIAACLSREVEELKLARVSVERKCDGKQLVAVFNLTVEGEHEFFANGVLVHNCDSFSGAYNELAQQVEWAVV